METIGFLLAVAALRSKTSNGIVLATCTWITKALKSHRKILQVAAVGCQHWTQTKNLFKRIKGCSNEHESRTSFAS
jgi:hypothetical protein